MNESGVDESGVDESGVDESGVHDEGRRREEAGVDEAGVHDEGRRREEAKEHPGGAEGSGAPGPQGAWRSPADRPHGKLAVAASAPSVARSAPIPTRAGRDERSREEVFDGSREDAQGAFERIGAGASQDLPLSQAASGGPGPLYRADPDRVLRVLAAHQFEDPFLAFRELYANAVDACRGRPEAGIDVRVAADRVILEDRGPGLDEAGLRALTTLGGTTKRDGDAIGRFGIGFASVFDPALGVASVQVEAMRANAEGGVLVQFEPSSDGTVGISVEDGPAPKCGGARVEVVFHPLQAPADRVARALEVFEVHSAYSGVQTTLNGRSLGRELSDFIGDALRSGAWTSAERTLVMATAVKGSVGVAAIDPARSESRFRAYDRGLFVTEIPLPRPTGRPWPRGVFGAVAGEGLTLVASRNAFVDDDRFRAFQLELRRLAQESAYRAVRHFEASGDSFTRLVLLDALWRGLKGGATPESLLVEADDLFSSALVRCPLFRSWGEGRRYTFAELVALRETERFSSLSYRPSRRDLERGPILRADDSLERDIFRKLSGMKDMPAAARAEAIARPSRWSRLRDRLLSGPRAEYSLFQRPLDPRAITPDLRKLVDAIARFLATEEVRETLARLLPGPLPVLGFGSSRNAFGPVAAYRGGEIRLNAMHRTIRRLAAARDPEMATRALLPVLAHELAHMCHEIHDLDFYRTSRTILRALVTATARLDARGAAS